MAEHPGELMPNLTITKGGETISAASGEPRVLGPDPRWPGVEALDCYYFPRLKLEPPIVWQVMGGAMLGKFFDHCNFEIEGGERVEDLRYVHGRSEVMRGSQYVSTVLLVRAQLKEPLAGETWISYLPAIYQEFMGIYDSSQKKA